MKRINYKYLVLASLTVLFGCNDSEKETAENTQSNEVEVTDSLQTVKALDDSPSSSTNVVKCAGDVQVPPQNKVTMHSKLKGIVKNIKVLEGEKIRRGQLLAQIEDIELIKLQEDYIKSKVEFEYQQEEYSRKKQLLESQSISKKEFLAVETSYLNSKAQFQSHKSQVEYVGLSLKALNAGSISTSMSIYATISGYIVDVSINEGEFVNADHKLFEIVDDSHKHVHLNVFPSDIERVKVGGDVMFSIAGNEKKYSGKVHLINKQVDAHSKSIGVHVHLDSTYNDLTIGAKVFGEISTI